jgi:AcrR family transcriptional regulator
VPETSPPGGRGKKGSSSRTKGASRSQSAGRAKGKQRRPLTREAIVETAVRIADEEALDAVSIRRVAAKLDARAMSLYDHISSKADLLSLMAEKVIEETLVEGPMPADWREALTVLARLYYATLVAHPWLAVSQSMGIRFGSTSKRAIEQVREATDGLPLDLADVWLIQGTVNDYVLGHALRAVTGPSSEGLKKLVPDSDVAETPALDTLRDSFRTRSSVERFEAGLRIVLDGVELEVLEGGRQLA